MNCTTICGLINFEYCIGGAGVHLFVLKDAGTNDGLSDLFGGDDENTAQELEEEAKQLEDVRDSSFTLNSLRKSFLGGGDLRRTG